MPGAERPKAESKKLFGPLIELRERYGDGWGGNEAVLEILDVLRKLD
ncbi:MAG: hypothetical protein ACJAX5_001267 [Patiriisocius sp.]|jgi:hypothetical protein